MFHIWHQLALRMLYQPTSVLHDAITIEVDVAGLLGISTSSGMPQWMKQGQGRGINTPSFLSTERYNTESCEKGFKTKASELSSHAFLRKGAWGP